ncbi:MAG: DUF1614 domain-containing protein [Candidatus Asgardarchaeia archaeon]
MSESRPKYSKRKLLYKPCSYGNLLWFFIGGMLTYFLFFYYFESALIYGLGFNSTISAMIIVFSLIGSYVNIPIKEVVSLRPIVRERYITTFFMTWIVPEIDWKEQRTIIAVNLGGAIIPVIVSIYLFYRMLMASNWFFSLAETIAAVVLVTYFANAVARPIPGIGIVMPGFLVPFITTLITSFLFSLYPVPSPPAIAYIAGTLGTLIGADLLNMNKIGRLGAPVASIGGAGTFDGIFLNGIFSTMLTLIYMI